MMEEFGEKLPYLHRYRSELAPLVHRTGRHLNTLLASIPGPITLDPDLWGKDPLIHAMFVTEADVSQLIDGSKQLQALFKNPETQFAYALLTAQKKVKSVTGTEKIGEILRRDVAQRAVYFEEHRITIPADELTKTRQMAQTQLFFDLFTMAAQKISSLKDLKSELEIQHDEITAKQSIFTDDNKLKEISEIHDTIDKKLEAVEASLDSPEDFISPLRELLQNPEKHLTAKTVSFRLNSMGIVITPSSEEKADPFLLAEFKLSNGNSWVATWIRVKNGNTVNPF